MSNPRKRRPAIAAAVYFTGVIAVGGYFTFAAVQGGHGVFQRIQAEAEIATLTVERDRLATELAELENRTRRLSDEYLDLDLLDQQARDMLGMLRADELVIR